MYHHVPLRVRGELLALESHSDPPALEPRAERFISRGALSSSVRWESFMGAPGSGEDSQEGKVLTHVGPEQVLSQPQPPHPLLVPASG